MQNIVVDANNMLYRAVGNSDSHRKKRGFPHKIVNGINITYIQSFFWFLYQSTKDYHNTDTDIYLVWDKKIDENSSNWRNDINPHYKAQRDQESEIRKSVHETTGHLKKISDAMGFKTVYPLSSEGDDIINYLINNLDGDSLIVSSDQDFYQCVSDTVWIYNPMKNFVLTKDNFEEHVPVSLENYVKWKAIKGDSSDNIKGLYKYGDVRSKKLVENWEELSEKLTNEDLEIIEDSVKLIDLNAVPLSENEIYAVEFQLNKVRQRFSDLELTKVLDSYGMDQNLRLLWDQYFDIKDMDNIYD